MAWPPKNYVESVLPMMTLYAIVGHEVFRYPASKPRVCWSICYTIVMLIATAILLYYTFLRASTFNYDTIEEKLFLVICWLKILIILCTGTLSWYHYNRRKRIVERITAIDETLTELGADCEHEKTYRAVIVCLMTQLALVVILNSVDTMWVINKYSAFEMIWLIGVMHHPYHVSNYVVMKHSMTMRSVAVRFRITNNILQEILKRNEGQQCLQRLRRATTISRQTLHRGVQIPVSLRGFSELRTVQIIKQVHLELCSISESLNKIYGVQIILQLGAYFAFLTVLGYDLYVIAVNLTFLNRSRRIMTLLFWFFVHFMKIFVVNHMSARVSDEAYRTRQIVQELNMMNDDLDFKDELRQFSLQLVENALSFNPMGFFTLGYGFVSSGREQPAGEEKYFVSGFFLSLQMILGTVATYLVILIQTNIIPEFMLVNNK